MAADMKIKSLAPWFGGKRTLAPRICAELGKHTQYFEPFAGSLAIILAKAPSQKETVNDLHGDMINLARVVADRLAAEDLYDRLQRVVFSEGLIREAQWTLKDTPVPEGGCGPNAVERSYWYFLACWMGRNGTSGTARVDYQIAVRWTKNGGSPTVRFRNAADSLPAWHRRLQNVVILRRDAFEILPRFEDVPQTAIYADPPYTDESRGDKPGQTRCPDHRYQHEFRHASTLLDVSDHQRLHDVLATFREARVVVSYYDCPRVRALYEGWTFVDCMMNKNLHAQNGRGARAKVAPEVLIINGPSYTSTASSWRGPETAVPVEEGADDRP
ncbi:MAG: DNA adenine methylase [Planctomycetaceae bacterium]|nr:DNA adenine methylase [Planctomycetaceae bacterium]